jgi:hypothetical protein
MRPFPSDKPPHIRTHALINLAIDGGAEASFPGQQPQHRLLRAGEDRNLERLRGRLPSRTRQARDSQLETAYCAEVVATTCAAMGLLPSDRRANWYDPGRFWSGDELELADGARLGGEIPVQIPLDAARDAAKP